MEPRVILALPVLLVFRDTLADKVGQEQQDPQDLEDNREIKEIRVLEKWEM